MIQQTMSQNTSMLSERDILIAVDKKIQESKKSGTTNPNPEKNE